jgi:hypothetical protein
VIALKSRYTPWKYWTADTLWTQSIQCGHTMDILYCGHTMDTLYIMWTLNCGHTIDTLGTPWTYWTIDTLDTMWTQSTHWTVDTLDTIMTDHGIPVYLDPEAAVARAGAGALAPLPVDAHLLWWVQHLDSKLNNVMLRYVTLKSSMVLKGSSLI